MPADLASSDLYEDDIVVWSDRQAALLRRLAAGERVNEQVDWGNVIEEIESLGRSERRETESLLTRALEHLLKLRGWPGGPVERWAHEARAFLRDAGRAWAPSMRQLIDLHELYADALAQVRRQTVDGSPPLALPEACPFGFDDLIVPRRTPVDVDALVAKLSA